MLCYAIMSNTNAHVQRYLTSNARNAHFSLTSWYINYIVACPHKGHVEFYVDQINSSVGIVLLSRFFQLFCTVGKAYL